MNVFSDLGHHRRKCEPRLLCASWVATVLLGGNEERTDHDQVMSPPWLNWGKDRPDHWSTVWSLPSTTNMLQFCYNFTTILIQTCYKRAINVLQLCYNCATIVLQLCYFFTRRNVLAPTLSCYNFATNVLQFCYDLTTILLRFSYNFATI